MVVDLPQVDPEASERLAAAKPAWREIDLFRLQEYTSD